MAPDYFFGIFTQTHELGLFIEFLKFFYHVLFFSAVFPLKIFMEGNRSSHFFFVGCSGLGEILLLLDLEIYFLK